MFSQFWRIRDPATVSPSRATVRSQSPPARNKGPLAGCIIWIGKSEEQRQRYINLVKDLGGEANGRKDSVTHVIRSCLNYEIEDPVRGWDYDTVTPKWIESCYNYWQRQPESSFIPESRQLVPDNRLRLAVVGDLSEYASLTLNDLKGHLKRRGHVYQDKVDSYTTHLFTTNQHVMDLEENVRMMYDQGKATWVLWIDHLEHVILKNLLRSGSMDHFRISQPQNQKFHILFTSTYPGNFQTTRNAIIALGARHDIELEETTNFICVSAEEYESKIPLLREVLGKFWQVTVISHQWLQDCIDAWYLDDRPREGDYYPCVSSLPFSSLSSSSSNSSCEE